METNDKFIAHGSYTVSNCGGYLVQISDCGDAARMKDSYGSDKPEISDWKEIEFITDEDDPEGDLIPVIDPEGYNIPLDMVMRINDKYTFVHQIDSTPNE